MTIAVLASGNPGKLREMADLLSGLDIDVVPQSRYGVPEADETGATFEANALIKARHAVAFTGLPAIADDSGLCVDALHGQPGVHSARYAGNGASDEDNIAKLLAALEGIDDRSAAFHCVVCYVTPDADDEPLVARGVWRGEILRERRGSGGFGYDPVFLDPDTGKASAELSAADKNARSHRGRALEKLRKALAERLT
ncbi:MAG: RdgB/HAM1 family non-canonical purine NTP pyrophosphatase [Woeseiaceae bacterium]|nr:RdgB/HAM1 family non-canonical purine NTP pyrophosphatase [Woeseiaceae bacterium]